MKFLLQTIDKKIVHDFGFALTQSGEGDRPDGVWSSEIHELQHVSKLFQPRDRINKMPRLPALCRPVRGLSQNYP